MLSKILLYNIFMHRINQRKVNYFPLLLQLGYDGLIHLHSGTMTLSILIEEMFKISNQYCVSLTIINLHASERLIYNCR